MTKRNKIIFIGLFLGFVIIFGIYLFPDEEPELADPRTGSPMETNRPNIQGKVSGPGPETNPVTINSNINETKQLTPKGIVSSEEPYVFYDEAILEMLGIDKNELFKERDKYKNTVVHVEWMDHVRDVLKNIDQEQLAAIVKNQTMHLYLKDKLNEAYLSGKIDQETFLKSVADLMKFHQRTYENMLSWAEYEALFEVTPDVADQYIDKFIIEDTPEYGFISNQKIPADEVVKQIQRDKMEEVNTYFKKLILEREQINKKIGDGSMMLEQARDALLKSQQAYIDQCKKILTEEEINTIFGSVAFFEFGGKAPPPSVVMGDDDIVQLGFKIENPTTSIDMVKEKLNQTQIEDIKFFYQQRDREREELINKLDTGEITEEVLEKTSAEMDSAFEENCREILTDEAFKMLFDVSVEKEIEKSTPAESNVEESIGPEEAGDETVKK